MSALLTAALDAVKEATGAQAVFPGNKQMLAAAIEEMGEVAKALLDHDRGKAKPEDVYAEAIQLAAMALRIAIEGSEEFEKYRFTDDLSRAFVPTAPKTDKIILLWPDRTAIPTPVPTPMPDFARQYPYHGEVLVAEPLPPIDSTGNPSWRFAPGRDCQVVPYVVGALGGAG